MFLCVPADLATALEAERSRLKLRNRQQVILGLCAEKLAQNSLKISGSAFARMAPDGKMSSKEGQVSEMCDSECRPQKVRASTL